MKHQVCSNIYVTIGFHFFKGASEDVPAYIRSTGKGWVNKKGKVSSMPVTGVTTKKRGKKAYLRVNTAEECETECTATEPCVAYTFVSMSNRCDLKRESDAVRLQPVFGGAVSGKLEGERPTQPTTSDTVDNSTICLPCLPGNAV